MAILNAREDLGFTPQIQSDVAPLSLLLPYLRPFAPDIHVMRDPTRGGLASVIHEIAQSSRVNVELWEENIPVRGDVRACCDLLGLDPLYIANEGKMVLWVSESRTHALLKVLRDEAGCKDAAHIGKVSADAYRIEVPAVSLKTRLGSRRFVPLLEGDPLPRIC
jgi:hydrogenase expression/formation protein HypE